MTLIPSARGALDTDDLGFTLMHEQLGQWVALASSRTSQSWTSARCSSGSVTAAPPAQVMAAEGVAGVKVVAPSLGSMSP